MELYNVNALLESAGEEFITENEEILNEMMMDANDLSKHLINFVTSNPAEFIGESVEETYKNIRIFSEIATSQYLAELSHIYGNISESAQEETLSSDSSNSDISDYL